MAVARIDALANGAHGVVRVDGKVHFVRHVAPGDEVDLVVREDHGSFAYADVTRVLSRGSAWRQPPCRYLPRCGGCPWQQVTYAEQLIAKQRIVGDLLERVGGLAGVVVQPVIPAPEEFGYRRRLSLRVEERQPGFFAGGTHDLVAIDECLLAGETLHGGIALVADLTGQMRTLVKRVELAAAGRGALLVIGLQAEGRFVGTDHGLLEARLRAHAGRLQGIAAWGRGWRRVWGDDRVSVPLPGGDSMVVPVGDFTQVGDAGNATLVATVLDLAGARPGVVLDLFCGGGNLSIPLARRAQRVDAVERSTASVELGRENARRLAIDNLVFHAGTAHGFLDERAHGLERGGRRGRGASGSDELPIDLVVLDPPRSGAAEAIPALRELGAPRLIYVSCDPATLARDLRGLGEEYAIETIQPIDLFPQTHHVETVVSLRRRAGAGSGPQTG